MTAGQPGARRAPVPPRNHSGPQEQGPLCFRHEKEVSRDAAVEEDPDSSAAASVSTRLLLHECFERCGVGAAGVAASGTVIAVDVSEAVWLWFAVLQWIYGKKLLTRRPTGSVSASVPTTPFGSLPRT